ncbi:hypothetical protein SDC9_108459 [bioreactor metagenome]|uniref:Uncharacterized protein n=1 Tax=bioreactor metagenome TaxID=1076179 RepID=A0A645B801_9ZZZZ
MAIVFQKFLAHHREHHVVDPETAARRKQHEQTGAAPDGHQQRRQRQPPRYNARFFEAPEEIQIARIAQHRQHPGNDKPPAPADPADHLAQRQRPDNAPGVAQKNHQPQHRSKTVRKEPVDLFDQRQVNRPRPHSDQHPAQVKHVHAVAHRKKNRADAEKAAAHRDRPRAAVFVDQHPHQQLHKGVDVHENRPDGGHRRRRGAEIHLQFVENRPRNRRTLKIGEKIERNPHRQQPETPLPHRLTVPYRHTHLNHPRAANTALPSRLPPNSNSVPVKAPVRANSSPASAP